jgi:hypothetical protein
MTNVDLNVMTVAMILAAGGAKFVRPQITDANRVHHTERSPERLSAAEAKRARKAAARIATRDGEVKS